MVMFFKKKTIVDLAVEEDIGSGDVTSNSIVSPHVIARAQLVTQEDGVVAGLVVLKKIFPDADIQFHVQDGAAVRKGQVLADISDNARSLLAGERVALNFLRHLSGVATLTRKYVVAAKGRVTILDTRKTMPGLRKLEKYAVRMGDGRNHRMGLYDMVLIKDNHIALAGNIAEAVRRARRTGLPVEVEVEQLTQFKEAVDARPDMIMLDNMSISDMRKAVRMNAGIPLEVSGGVTLEKIPLLSTLGVQYISVGALTHSAPALDISLTIH